MKSTAAAVALVAAVALLVPTGAAAAQGAPGEEPVQLNTPTGTIHGTLLVPPDAGPHPVALLIAGSGPTDRDGNSPALPGRNDSLKQLAEGLAARGIASLRYDKRGIAASAAAGPSEADLRFEAFVDDAAAWTRVLRADVRFSTITIVGHSEGSLIGMLAAEQGSADGYVSVAGIARGAADILRDQLRPQLPPELWAENERILTSLEAGEAPGPPPPVLQALYRPSVQPYLISWFRYVPTEVITELEIPVLIAQGTTDIQVPVTEAHALHGARPAAELLIVEEMNHVLKLVPADPARQQASYSDPSLPVAPALVEAIGRFIVGIRR